MGIHVLSELHSGHSGARKRREEDVDREEPRARKKGRFEKSRLALKKKIKGKK